MANEVKLDIRDFITRDLQKKIDDLDKVPRQTYEYWVDITPIRSGRAKRSTRLRGDEIQAQYPYAERLDSGYSRQAPRGMSEPTQKFLKRLTDRIIRRK